MLIVRKKLSRWRFPCLADHKQGTVAEKKLLNLMQGSSTMLLRSNIIDRYSPSKHLCLPCGEKVDVNVERAHILAAKVREGRQWLSEAVTRIIKRDEHKKFDMPGSIAAAKDEIETLIKKMDGGSLSASERSLLNLSGSKAARHRIKPSSVDADGASVADSESVASEEQGEAAGGSKTKAKRDIYRPIALRLSSRSTPLVLALMLRLIPLASDKPLVLLPMRLWTRISSNCRIKLHLFRSIWTSIAFISRATIL